MVFIRTDANEVIATGHMMRCITIARELIEEGNEVVFLLSDEKSKVLPEEYGMNYIILDTEWDHLNTKKEIDAVLKIIEENKDNDKTGILLLVDSYYVGNAYFIQLRPHVKIAMIDDFGDSAYDVDILINYNITCEREKYEEIYRGADTKLLLGPRYMPLRRQFMEILPSKTRNSGKNEILLICGGANPQNVLLDIVNAFIKSEITADSRLNVVVGRYNDKTGELRNLSEEYKNVIIYNNVENMAELMKNCDVAVSAASTVLYECCAMKLPTVFFVVAENQKLDAEAFSKNDIMIYAGDIQKKKKETIENIFKGLKEIFSDDDRKIKMKKQMEQILDGRGAKRTVSVLQRIFETGSFYEEENKKDECIDNVRNWLDSICKGRSIVYTCDGRDAIEYAVQEIGKNLDAEKRICLLPVYTCDSVVMPFEKNGWKVSYYPLNEKLEIDTEKIKELVEELHPCIFLSHTYFGVDSLNELRNLMKEYRNRKDFFYIEDVTQSLYILPDIVMQADYVVGSLRKWYPVSDGGFCICEKKDVFVENYDTFDEFSTLKQEAQELKREYLYGEFINKKEFLETNNFSEDLLYKKKSICRISETSLKKLGCEDYKYDKRQRNRNMKFLYEKIRGMNEVKCLVNYKGEESPLYFPIIVRNRREIQDRLRANDIYAPILWPVYMDEKKINADIRKVYDNMLALPCDSRYDERDMERITRILKEKV